VKAAVYTGPGAIELREWPDPAAGPGELLIRMRGCGLCGSDIAKFVSGARAPAVFGHEVVGEVARVGAGVTRFAAGQRVVVAHHVPCFDCHYCRRGSPSMCPHFKRVNLDPGGFAELVRVPAPNVEHATFALPAELSDETASFTEPLACCLRALRRAGVAAGDTALVVGLGSIGCLFAQALRAIRYTSGGYTSGTLRKISPRSKNASDTEKARSASRSRLRSENGRRRSPRPTKKTTQRPSQTYQVLSVLPPKAPVRPRAIFQATCGPVHASATRPLVSSTMTSAICPASPDHALTTQVRGSGLNVAEVVGLGG